MQSECRYFQFMAIITYKIIAGLYGRNQLDNGYISTKCADCNSSTYPHKYLNDYYLKTDAMATQTK